MLKINAENEVAVTNIMKLNEYHLMRALQDRGKKNYLEISITCLTNKKTRANSCREIERRLLSIGGNAKAMFGTGYGFGRRRLNESG